VFAQGFDAQAGRLVGEPQSVLDNITGYSTALTSVTPFSASDVGSLVYRVGANAPVSRLTWFDRLGTRLGEVGEPGRHRQIVLSPDARTVALNTFDDDGRLVVFLLDLLRNVATRFTSDRAGDPVWAPDSRALAFTQRGAAAIAQRRLDEATAHTLWESTERGVLRYVESWSPDGTGLVFEEGSAIGILPLDPGAKPFTWIDTPFDKDEPHFSPDGRWIAYQAFDSGSYEVYVQAYPKPGAQIRVSTAGGGAPRWRADGRELFYLTPDGALMAVAVTPGPSIQFGTPRQLFQTPITNLELNIDQYDVSPDGQRFLVLVPEPTDDLGVNVVLNWTSGLDATGRR
jgi:Tol biopolymer transport system component